MSQPTISDATWNEAYTQLHVYAKKLVYSLHVPSWQGQEEEVAWDIVQESMSRFVEYTQKAERGERVPVRSMIALLKMIARNYGRDLRRREWRLRREDADMLRELADNGASFSEVAVENVYRERIFHSLAREIASFPKKQQRSVLTDLARRMAFGETPTTLEAAFRSEGIFLEEYCARADDERERSRNASLRTYAYKRLYGLEVAQNYRNGRNC